MTSSQGIYIIAGTESNRAYIGSTINFRQRWINHRSHLRRGVHSNPHLQRAWNKYGEDTFEFGVLEYLDDPEELHLAEQFWMDIYREEGTELYNFGLAARGVWLGQNLTEEHCRRISEAKKGKKREPFSQEWRDRLSEAGRRRASPSDETRAKLSKALSGTGNPMWGKHHTEERRRQISKELRSRPPISDKTRRKLSRAKSGENHPMWGKRGEETPAWGKRLTEETKRKISEANKGVLKGYIQSEEHKRRKAESCARPYPAFIHRDTGEIIPAGINLSALCQERELCNVGMCAVKNGRRSHCKGWMLQEIYE